jgi:hypothetical protein
MGGRGKGQGNLIEGSAVPEINGLQTVARPLLPFTPGVRV